MKGAIRALSPTEISTDRLHEQTLRLAAAILDNRQCLRDILTEIATRSAAEDEINRSVRTLAGAAWEIGQHRPPRIDRLSLFLPSNNVLYSYTLFGLVPSLYARRVDIRPSSRSRRTAQAVHELLSGVHPPIADGALTLVEASQREFIAGCARSDAVVFTGQYENAIQVMEKLDERICFLFLGSGPNPLIVGPQSDPGPTGRALLNSRLYNSGQDCLSTDLVFVHRSVLDATLDRLSESLRRLPLSDRGAPGAVVSALVYPDAARAAGKYLEDHAESVVHGGGYDSEALLVEPTVIVHESSEKLHPPEMFSPIFNIVPYDDPIEIEHWASAPLEVSRGMYAMVFGEPRIPGPRLGSAVVLRDMTTFDHEDGNRPFGGYGWRAGSVRERSGVLAGRPVLLSAELAAWTAE